MSDPLEAYARCESPRQTDGSLKHQRVDSAGRVVIPADFRKRLMINPGDEVVLHLRDDRVELLSPCKTLLKVQEALRQYVGGDSSSVVDELLADRRAEVKRGD